MAAPEYATRQQRTKQEGKRAKAQPATHRLRLFKYESEELERGESIFVEVWDTTEQPVASAALPPGKPVFESTDDSVDRLEVDADRFCQSVPSAEIIDWRDLCSI